ncbi:hypothetical protein RB195_026008 [Necator americanus]|uniref:Uncharacterized protein n=1 Tax=Necator americanus TaxID=51031 RepID=A0ABR1EUV9_NECAM
MVATRKILGKDALKPLLHLTPQRNACGIYYLYHQRSQAAILLIHNSPHRDVQIGDFGSTAHGNEEALFHGNKLFRGLLGYLWPRVPTTKFFMREKIYGGWQVKNINLGPPSKVATKYRLCFFGHILRKSAQRCAQSAVRSFLGPSRSRSPGRKPRRRCG